MPQKKQSVDSTVAEQCLAVRLRLLNRVVSKIYDDSLRDQGLRVSQLNILVAVSKMQIAQPSEICRVLHLDASTLSRNVERMKNRDWIEVAPSDDRREQPLRLTKQGRKILDAAMPGWHEAQRKTQELIGADGVALLKSVSKRLGSLT